MLKIDMHTHIIPKTMPNWTEKFGYGKFINLCLNMIFLKARKDLGFEVDTIIVRRKLKLTTVKIIEYLFSMNNYFIKDSKK